MLAACHSALPVGDDDDDQADAAGSGTGSSTPGRTNPFDPTTTRVVVEIDYETGQEPYTGEIITWGDTFEPTVANIDRLFAHKKTLDIPTTLPQMQDIGAVNDETLTAQDILNIASVHRNQHDAPGTKTYYIVFVSGYFADDSGPRTSVLGVSIGNTDVVAMFKDVIRTTFSVTPPNAERYVEQSTLIHELAHSIGLVDNGVPMVNAHKDNAHGAHCNNSNCVMYWLNEGASDARTFAINRLVTGNVILFDTACLADVDAQTGGP